MSAKQDRTFTRTASDLERKYNFGQTFGEYLGQITQAQRTANEANSAVSVLNQKLGKMINQDQDSTTIYRTVLSEVETTEEGTTESTEEVESAEVTEESTETIETIEETEYLNPPLENDVEYLTYARHQGKAVRVKLDSVSGQLLWSTDRSTWNTFAVLMGAAPATEDADNPGCYYRTVEGEKEWFNPPMALGEEYRTVEKCLGKPVYTKAVDFGELPATAAKTVNYSSVEATLVWLNLVISDGCVLGSGYGKDMNFSDSAGMYIDNTKTDVRVTTEDDFSGLTAIAIVKYTKD